MLAGYKEQLSSNTRDRKEYIDQKAKVFGVILGQCTRELISRLEATPSFEDIEKMNNIIGLLDLLKTTSHSKGGCPGTLLGTPASRETVDSTQPRKT